jgi:hypothetical protein
MDGAGPQASVPSEEGASLEQAAVVLRDETISGPHAVLFFQDVKNIGSPFTSPALSVLFFDISDQVRETTLAATHAGEACWMVHDSELFPVSAAIRKLDATPSRYSLPKIRLLLSEFKLSKETKNFHFLYWIGMMAPLLREEEEDKRWIHKFTRTCWVS